MPSPPAAERDPGERNLPHTTWTIRTSPIDLSGELADWLPAERDPQSNWTTPWGPVIPRETLRQLPEDVANNPLVRGRAGAPNRWRVPRDQHVDIHRGAGGGAYNQAWKDALEDLGREPTVDDVLRIRDRLSQQFGLERYRPGQ